jgi:hypothetical protein
MDSTAFVICLTLILLASILVVLLVRSLANQQVKMLTTLLEQERLRTLDLTNRVMSKEWGTYLTLASQAPPQVFESAQVDVPEYMGMSDEEELRRQGLEDEPEVLFDQEAEFRSLGLIDQ